MSVSFGGVLEGLVSYPVFIGSIIVAIVSISLLIVKWKSMKKELRILFIILGIISGLVLAFFIALIIGFGGNSPIADPVPLTIESTQIFHLENATDHDRFTTLIAVTLHDDGSVEFALPHASSYHHPEYRYSFSDDELLIHAVVPHKIREQYDLDNDEVVARFSIKTTK